MEPIARYLDAAILKPDMTPEQVDKAIDECIALKTMTVCVRGCDIDRALKKCAGTETKVSCVLDFPYGYSGAAAKRAIARDYAARGVYEIDMVMNYGAAKGGDWAAVREEIFGVVEEAHARGVLVKVIFETCELSEDCIRQGVDVCVDVGADFVKTSTGFAAKGATPEAVMTMVSQAAGRVRVKASGGIRTLEDARAYVEMGAERLGVGFSTVPKLVAAESAAK